ncbi:MAG TPA: ThuA domain-containing protein [Planctomycetota bacterium]|nr:ThuA domain-containing protein [Planctomycetota bacterium]HRR81844.1 ThuA domain-containing protein [Planctomycetota bacterium]HRT93586.1 ThuA domain-containing protein [Planctomycetota bacterium]
MRRAGHCLAVAACAALALALVSQATAAEKINLLIIDGQHNHNWKATTPVVKDLLAKTERFNVDVVTTPPKGAPADEWDKFKPDFSKYQVVLMNYAGEGWAPEINTALAKFVEGGGGLVFYHAAVFAFPQWPEWNKMMGMGWRAPGFGDRVALDDDGKLVKMAKGEGPGGGHGPAHAFEVIVRDKEHPVMKGLPEKWMHVKDELYHGMRGPCENMAILATAFSSKEGKGTGMHEPMVWTVAYGKGRVFVSVLGHDPASTAVPDAATLLCRGAEWAATGQVTIPVPAEFTTTPGAPGAAK